MKREIDLSTLKPGKLDLTDYKPQVLITGHYEGDRIVIDAKSASGKTLLFKDATITSTRMAPDKDAIAFNGELKDCRIYGDNCKLIYGGLTFWDRLENVTISNLQIYYPNAGIKASQDFTNLNVKIEKCEIVGAQREGIYFGPHTGQQRPSNGLVIAYNIIRFSGWDAIQFNAINAQVYGNIIDNPATLEQKDQWFGILAQIGSIGYVHDNQFINARRPRAFLDSRIFEYQKQLI